MTGGKPAQSGFSFAGAAGAALAAQTIAARCGFGLPVRAASPWDVLPAAACMTLLGAEPLKSAQLIMFHADLGKPCGLRPSLA